MALTHLFQRCPVLPVDASLSLARYLDSVEQTRAAAAACERAGPEADVERAALLHLRVVQLVAKTLPSHPDRTLPASASTLARLNAAAHDSLDAVERISRTLSTASSVTPISKAPRATSGRVQVQVPAPLLDVFANMVRERVRKGMRAVGVLAGRAENGECGTVSALVVPPQAEDGSEVLLEEQVVALAGHKGLVVVGVVVHAGGARRAGVQEGERLFAGRMTGGEGVAVVVAPEAEERVVTFDIAGTEVRETENVRFAGDELSFKLYDLRPLVRVKEERDAGGAGGAEG